MGKYKTKITEYGYELINKALSGNGAIITDEWYIALGDGDLEPDCKTTRLNNIVFDKNSPNYPGIIISKDKNGRYAEIVLPESLHGYIITEIGLFDEKNCLVAAANTKIDCTERTEQGFDIDYRARISLNAIDKDIVIQFQGGTFQLLEEKGEAYGYAPLDNEAKVPLEHLPSTFIPFCFNSGPVNENGEPALLELSTVIETIPSKESKAGAVTSGEDARPEDGGVTGTTQATWNDSSPGAEREQSTTIKKTIITLKSPAVYTDGNGKTVNITEDLTLDVTNFTPGKTYSLRVQETSSGVDFDAVEDCKVYRQKNEPENPINGDLWQNLSVAPYLAYIYLSALGEDLEPVGSWQLTNQVEAGTYTVPEITQNLNSNSDSNSGGGGKLVSNPYNFNKEISDINKEIIETNYKVDDTSRFMPDYSAGISLEKTITNKKIIDNGYIYWNYQSNRNMTAQLYINDSIAGCARHNDSQGGTAAMSIFIPVSKGDAYRLTTITDTVELIFYPLKDVTMKI